MRRSRIAQIKATGIALIIIGLIIGLAVGYVAFSGGEGGGGETTTTGGANQTGQTGGTQGQQPCPPCEGLSGEIPIGLALPLSGSLAADGKDMVEAAKMAIEDINSLLQAAGAPFHFKVYVADTKTNPQGGGLQAVQTLYEQFGCKVIIGTASSAVLQNAMDYANSHHIVMISPSSTSPALAIPNDYIFRVVGNDKGQGKALAKLVWSEGYKKVVVIFRNEAYGAGIANAFKENFEAMGGQVKLLPYTPDQPDYAAEVQQLSQEIQNFGADSQTAVLIIAFETDGLNILGHAKDDPVLSNVRWFSSESIRSPALIPPDAPEGIAQFLLKVNFTGTFPIPAESPLTQEFKQRLSQRVGREEISAFAAYSYDAAWIAALSIMTAGKYDGPAVKAVLPDIAKHYYGVTGWKILTDDGDAKIQDYSIWTYTKTPEGKYTFADIGLYNSETGEIIYKGD